ncbi:MAG: methylmalonyl Co-A mutase-associated GTPase MeaB [Desulfurococcales archaeon]|nr:methylmalonyl Co-A mutase-associated GTPase MeaB [Desulfurococcales archaeon]
MGVSEIVLPQKIQNLLDRAIKGDIRAVGKILSILETPTPESIALLEYFERRAGRAHVIGVTGIPGAGKSTLIGKLIKELRGRGFKVAVIAIDPTSPISHGSLLGDRLRMQEYSTDPGVFIRSISTRGLKGGLSLAALAMVEAFDALGYDFIILETVGVGQAEVDVANAAHTIIVVTMPGAGDDIQALKAGVMEIGDIYVVNKSDKPEASKTYEFIVFSVEKGDLGPDTGWTPRVLMVSALMNRNVDKLVDTILEHSKYLKERNIFSSKIRERRRLLAYYMVKSSIDKIIDEYITKIDINTEEIRIKDIMNNLIDYICSKLPTRTSN